MTLQTEGPISFADIQTEFGGSTPLQISSYYRGGARVPNHSGTISIPTSGQISFHNFTELQLMTLIIHNR